MKNRKFRDLSNNKIVEVTDTFEDIAILDGKSKIRTNQLLDKRMFEEYVDPSSFLRNDGFINTFAEQIKKIPLDDWKNRIPAEELGYDKDDFTQRIDESAVLLYDPEIEKEELLRKAQTMYGSKSTNQAIQKQMDSLRGILEEDDVENLVMLPEEPVVTNNVQQVKRETIQVETKEQKSMDPILEMFKNVKRNTNFKIDFTVENKIPRIDFIEMMEDSYNTSIIEFLAQEFTDDILKDPSIIKEKIKGKLHDLVYPDVENNRKLND